MEPVAFGRRLYTRTVRLAPGPESLSWRNEFLEGSLTRRNLKYPPHARFPIPQELPGDSWNLAARISQWDNQARHHLSGPMNELRVTQRRLRRPFTVQGYARGKPEESRQQAK